MFSTTVLLPSPPPPPLSPPPLPVPPPLSPSPLPVPPPPPPLKAGAAAHALLWRRAKKARFARSQWDSTCEWRDPNLPASSSSPFFHPRARVHCASFEVRKSSPIKKRTVCCTMLYNGGHLIVSSSPSLPVASTC